MHWYEREGAGLEKFMKSQSDFYWSIHTNKTKSQYNSGSALGYVRQHSANGNVD